MKAINLTVKSKSFIFSLLMHMVLLCALCIVCSKPAKLGVTGSKTTLKVLALVKRRAEETLRKISSPPNLISGLPSPEQRRLGKQNNALTRKIFQQNAALRSQDSTKEDFPSKAHNRKITTKTPPDLSLSGTSEKRDKELPASIAGYYPPRRKTSNLQNNNHAKKNMLNRKFTRSRRVNRQKAALPQQLYAKQAAASESEQEGIINSFKTKVFEKIAKNKKSPRWPKRHNTTIKVKVLFELKRDGSIGKLRLLTPSRLAILNRAAINSVKAGIPYPPFPQKLKKDFLAMGVTIAFR